MAKAIDTLKSAQALIQAGINQKEAEAIVQVVSDAEEGLATKSDIRELKTHLHIIEAIGVGLFITLVASLIIG